MSIAPSGEQAIKAASTEVDVLLQDRSLSFDQAYELRETVEKLSRAPYKFIVLQFPDSQLPDSPRVYAYLRSHVDPSKKIYVGADSTYAPCCIDHITAAHVEADCIVHYGRACYSSSSKIPVIYVLPKLTFSEDDRVEFSKQISKHLTTISETDFLKNVQLIYDPGYAWCIDNVISLLDKSLSSAIQISPFCFGNSSISIASDHIIYLGPPIRSYLSLLCNTSIPLTSYDPTASPSLNPPTLTSRRRHQLLMRRYTCVQKARDCDTFALLIEGGFGGTSGLLPLLEKLRAMLKERKKKVYTIAVGRVNPAKVANFSEVECFVLVGCKESELVWEMEKAKDFNVPIITPYELFLALQPQEKSWTGEYTTSWDWVLSNNLDPLSPVPSDEDGDGDDAVFSAVTGKLRTRKMFEHKDLSGGTSNGYSSLNQNSLQLITSLTGQLTLTDSEKLQVARLLGSASGEHLINRQFRGLDTTKDFFNDELDPSAGSDLQTGRSGIARQYGDDHHG